MTKTAAKKTVAETNSILDSVKSAYESVQSKMEVPASARDFVKRTASTAQERAESVHETAANFTTSAEKLATRMVGGYANLTRGLLDMTLANVQHSLATVEKLAGVKSINEAVQVQADFVRDNARANYERVREAADTAKSVVTEGAKTVQAEIAKIYAFDKKAA
ncbi:MAG TPA: phasin family protein [Rhizobiaceae bacterium]|nr:phasin family protein [Rhizobiaceae bacterium]